MYQGSIAIRDSALQSFLTRFSLQPTIKLPGTCYNHTYGTLLGHQRMLWPPSGEVSPLLSTLSNISTLLHSAPFLRKPLCTAPQKHIWSTHLTCSGKMSGILYCWWNSYRHRGQVSEAEKAHHVGHKKWSWLVIINSPAPYGHPCTTNQKGTLTSSVEKLL
jgi:hypothetical protein